MSGICAICLELWDRPVAPPCGHVFCEKCLNKHIRCSRSLEVTCPTCKQALGLREHRARPAIRRLFPNEEEATSATPTDATKHTELKNRYSRLEMEKDKLEAENASLKTKIVQILSIITPGAAASSPPTSGGTTRAITTNPPVQRLSTSAISTPTDYATIPSSASANRPISEEILGHNPRASRTRPPRLFDPTFSFVNPSSSTPGQPSISTNASRPFSSGAAVQPSTWNEPSRRPLFGDHQIQGNRANQGPQLTPAVNSRPASTVNGNGGFFSITGPGFPTLTQGGNS